MRERVPMHELSTRVMHVKMLSRGGTVMYLVFVLSLLPRLGALFFNFVGFRTQLVGT